MKVVAYRMQYVMEDSVTEFPTTNLFRRQNYPNATTEAPKFIEDYKKDVESGKKNTKLLELLINLRKDKNFRNGFMEMMVEASTHYKDWELPERAIGYKITILWKFPGAFNVPDQFVFMGTYNTYTEEAEMGIRKDDNLEYLNW
tara:strand:- start:89 stop:520 length:432 start_codon:yes stop_codon:yes gene_type:complete